MHRKTFLRQAAITLPAAMLAPELLFSANKTGAAQTSTHDVVVIKNPAAPEGLMASGKNMVSIIAERVTGISFTNGQWRVDLSGGNSYLTQKLVINSTGFEVAANNLVQVKGLAKAQQICFGQNRNLKAAKRQEKQNTPQVWMHCHEKLDAQAFAAFVSKNRPVLLYID